MEVEMLQTNALNTPQQETGSTEQAQETRCDGLCSLTEANNAGRPTLSPLNRKVWQLAKGNPATALGEEQIRLSVEEVSKCSSVVQIEPQKMDPLSKCEDQEDIADKESVSQPLNSEKKAQPQAEGEGDTDQAKTEPQKCKLTVKKTAAAVIVAVVVMIFVVLGICLNQSSGVTDSNHSSGVIESNQTSGVIESGQSPEVIKWRCYTCVDRHRCSKIQSVYDKHGELYQRSKNDSIPKCCGLSLPPPGKCIVCTENNTIAIVCPKDTVPWDVEDEDLADHKDSLKLEEIPPVSVDQPCRDKSEHSTDVGGKTQP